MLHLYLAIEGKLAAVICVEDPLREEAADAVRELKEAGITKVVMMTVTVNVLQQRLRNV